MDLMSMLKQKLLGTQGAAPAPQPEFQGNPWDNPILAGKPAPQPMAPPLPPQTPMGQPPMEQMPMGQPQDMAAVGAMNPMGTPSPMDEALMLALKRKRFNQAFAGGTGNPTPQ